MLQNSDSGYDDYEGNAKEEILKFEGSIYGGDRQSLAILKSKQVMEKTSQSFVKNQRESRDQSMTMQASKEGLNQTDEKLKNTEFPLDHILPVFNLSKKEFIPTLKVRQQEFKNKEQKGVIKGLSLHSQQPSQGSIEKIGLILGSSNPVRDGFGNKPPKHIFTGTTFRERKINGNAPELISTLDFIKVPLQNPNSNSIQPQPTVI